MVKIFQVPDHTYDMRRCPLCHGLVDDDLCVPRCCNCGIELKDQPGGPCALTAPSGRKLQAQKDMRVPKEEGLDPSIISFFECPCCGSREVSEKPTTQTVHMRVKGNPVTIQVPEVPVLTCHGCGIGWTDHRGERLRDEAAFAVLSEAP